MKRLLLLISVLFLLALPMVFSAENVNVAGQAQGGVFTSDYFHVSGPPANFNDENDGSYWNVNSAGIPPHGTLTVNHNYTVTNMTVKFYGDRTSEGEIMCWDYTGDDWVIVHTFSSPATLGVIMYFNNTEDCVTDKLNFSWPGGYGGSAYEFRVYNGTPIPSDITPPGINITSPVNDSTITVDFVDLNWTVNETVDWAGYSLDDATNVSLVNIICYQETANVSTACGGLATGKYSCVGNFDALNPCIDNAYDEDYSSRAAAADGEISYFYVNYTVPTRVSSSIWQFKTLVSGAPTIFNYTIDSSGIDCLNNNIFQGRVKLETNVGGTSGNCIFSCFNEVSSWETIFTSAGGGGGWQLCFFEEAMFWNMSSNTTLKSLSDGLHNVTIYANDTAGNMGQSLYTYWTVSTAPVDSCTAPGSGDWNIDCSDNCVLDSAQDVVADMHLNGIGTIVLSAPLTFTESNQIFSVASGCTLDIRSGGEIGGT